MHAPELIIIVLLVQLSIGCENQNADGEEPVLNDADPERGAYLIRDKACGSCHVIPDIDRADGNIGPPLSNWAERAYIAGTLTNNTDNLIRWLTETHQVDPDTAMPELDLTEREARHIAAYLYTLREEEL